MKRLKSTIVFLLLSAVTFAAAKYDFAVENQGTMIYYQILTQSTAAVTYGTVSYSGNVTIPASVQNQGTTYTVTEVADYAFMGCSGLSKLTLPNTITTIGLSAFSSSDLETIQLPSNITKISGNLFHSCTSLKSITIPDNVTKIDSYAFYHCSGLTEIVIPSKVATLGTSCFEGCLSLKKITIGRSVSTVNSYVLSSCYNLQTVIFEEGIKKIPRLSMPNVTNVTLPPSAVEIADYAFSSCDSLSKIEFGNSLQTIGKSAFYKTGLKRVILGPNVKTISDNAFSGCSDLAYVQLPASVDSLGQYAFGALTSLDTLWVERQLPLSITNYVFQFTNTSTSHLIVPANSLDAYKAATGWKAFTNIEEVPIIKLTDIALNQNSATLHVDDTIHLFVSKYLPDDAMKKSVDWTCSDNTVAVLGSDSVVTALNPGTAVFTATAKDGSGVKAECTVVVLDYNIEIVRTEGAEPEKQLAESGSLFTIDDSFYSFKCMEQIDDVEISYTRNFSSSGIWQAWFVPFDVDYSDMSSQFDVAKILGVLTDENGSHYVAFGKMTDGVVKANTPYVVKPKSSGDITVEATTTLYPTSDLRQYTAQSMLSNFTFSGLYQQTVNGDKGWYALNNSGWFQLMADTVYLRPFRIWMTFSQREDGPYGNDVAPAEVKIKVIGDEATGIQTASEVRSEEFGVRSVNLAGQAVESGFKGIVIKNGKKYLAR